MAIKPRVPTAPALLVLMALIGAVDLATTSSIKVIALYQLPVFLGSYYVRRSFGYLLAIAAAAFAFAVEYSGHPTIDPPLIINTAMLLAAYLTVVQLSSLLARRNRAIKESRDAKELIIRDIHHRMKNQMSSLLSLMRLSEAEGESETMTNLYHRINAYYMLYDRLCYQSKTQTRVNARAYLESLLAEIVASKAAGEKELRVAISGLDFEMDNRAMITVGLIVNELATNSIKHAFQGRKAGTIAVTGQLLGGTLSLTYSDDGPGFAYGAPSAGSGVGMLIVQSLVDQMQGRLSYTTEGGATCTMTLRVGGAEKPDDAPRLTESGW